MSSFRIYDFWSPVHTSDCLSTAERIIEDNPIIEEMFRDYLEATLDADGPVEIAGVSHFPSEWLEHTDPETFRDLFEDFAYGPDSIYDEIYYTLNEMNPGDSVEFYGVKIECLA